MESSSFLLRSQKIIFRKIKLENIKEILGSSIGFLRENICLADCFGWIFPFRNSFFFVGEIDSFFSSRPTEFDAVIDM